MHAFLGLLLAWIWKFVLPLQSADVRTEAEASTLQFPFVPQAMSKVGNQVLHSISCSDCQYGNLQVCIDISSWTVGVSNTQGLQGAVQSLFATESNVGNCTACSGMACLKRRKQLTTASQYIMIHLSLFTFNATTQQPSKLQCFYGCPSHFTIEDCFVRSPNKVLHLQLMSIILHRGSSTLSGHYVCMTQRKGLWYACDDEGVTLVEVPNQWLLNNDDFTPYMYMFKTTIQDLNNAHPSDKGVQTNLYEKGIHISTLSALDQMSNKDCESVHDCTLSATEHISNMCSDNCTGQEGRRGTDEPMHDCAMSAADPLSDESNDTCNDQDDTSSSTSHCTTTTSNDSNESGDTQMSVPSTRSGSPANADQTSDFQFTTMLATLPSSLSPSPLAKVESFIDVLSAELSPFPTIPWAFQNCWGELKSNGIVLPQKHCAFRSCTWQGNEQASLIEHVTGHHKASFAHVDQLSHACITMQDAYHLYQEAIAHIERQRMPLVGFAIDRRNTVSFAQRYRDGNIKSLVCSICAQIRSVDFEYHGRPPVQSHSPFEFNNGGSFFGMCKEDSERLLGLTTHFNAYGTKDSGMRQQVQTKWCLNVPFTDGINQVLCCPEDRRCVACPRNACGIHDMNCPLCPKCELPICASCSDELSRTTPKNASICFGK